MTVGNVAGASLLQLINHRQVHSVCPKVTKGYSAAMDTFFALSPARWWMEILSKGKSANPAKTHGCGAGNNYHIWYTFHEIYFDGEFVCIWRLICCPAIVLLLTGGGVTMTLRGTTHMLGIFRFGKGKPLDLSGAPYTNQNMPSTNYMVDKSS